MLEHNIINPMSNDIIFYDDGYIKKSFILKEVSGNIKLEVNEEKTSTPKITDNYIQSNLNFEFSELLLTQLCKRLDDYRDSIPLLKQEIEEIRKTVNKFIKDLEAENNYENIYKVKISNVILTKIVPALYKNILINISKYSKLFKSIYKDIEHDPKVYYNNYVEYCKKNNITQHGDPNSLKVETYAGVTYIETSINNPYFKKIGSAYAIVVHGQEVQDLQDDELEIKYEEETGINHQKKLNKNIGGRILPANIIFSNRSWSEQRNSQYNITFKWTLYHELGHLITGSKEEVTHRGYVDNLAKEIALEYFNGHSENRSDMYACIMSGVKPEDVFEMRWATTFREGKALGLNKSKEEIKKMFISNLTSQIPYIRKYTKFSFKLIMFNFINKY